MIVLHTLLVHSILRVSRYETLRHTKLLSLTTWHCRVIDQMYRIFWLTLLRILISRIFTSLMLKYLMRLRIRIRCIFIFWNIYHGNKLMLIAFFIVVIIVSNTFWSRFNTLKRFTMNTQTLVLITGEQNVVQWKLINYYWCLY